MSESTNLINVVIERFFDALHFGECFIQVWYIDREMIEQNKFFKYKSCSSDFPPSNKKKFDWFGSRQDGLI